MRTVKKFSIAFAKWVFIACAVGVIGGIVGSLFHMAVNFATGFRECHSWTLYLMPLAGLFIIFSYRVCKVNEETGTNLIISSVRSRCQIFELKPLEKEDIITCLKRVSAGEDLTVEEEVYAAIAKLSSGDVRNAINLLDVASMTVLDKKITMENICKNLLTAKPNI